MTLDLWRALIGAIIGVVTFSVFCRITNGRPTRRGHVQMQGILATSRVYIAGSVVVMGGLGLVLLGPWFTAPSPIITALGVMCFGLAALSLTGLLPVFAVTWDAQGMTAPATFLGILVPGQRRIFAWDSLVAAGSDLLGNQFVEDTAGRKLRWNFSYRGHRALMRAIAAYRPDLF